MERLTRIAVFVVVERDGRLLLGRGRNAFGHDEYSVPCGHLEYDEKLDACAARELKEETGLAADGFELVALATTNSKYDERHQDAINFLIVGFKAKGVKGEPVLLEPEKCFGWEWFDKCRLPEPLYHPAGKILENYLNNKVYG